MSTDPSDRALATARAVQMAINEDPRMMDDTYGLACLIERGMAAPESISTDEAAIRRHYDRYGHQP